MQPSFGTVRAFGSGDDPGQWIFRGDVGLGTVSAFGSKCNPGRSTPDLGIPDLETLEHSVLEMALDSGLTEGISHLELLEHSVLDMALDGGLTKGDGGLKFGPDRKLTLSEIPHAMRNDDLMLGAPVPLPAENAGRVALSPADGRLRAGDVNTDGYITTGLQCWSTEGDVLDQYETFNGMPVYYGGDMYDSEVRIEMIRMHSQARRM